jgi:hypothetical protein
MPPLPRRTRAPPHRLQHEQEDHALQSRELAQLLTAIRFSNRSSQPVSNSDTDSGSDTDGDSAERGEEENDEKDEKEEEEVDEGCLFSSLKLTDKEKTEYAKDKDAEEEAGWKKVSAPIAVHTFNPVDATLPRPILQGLTTPLDFFHALLPPTFMDDLTERTNAYAEKRQARGKENIPTAISTRAHEEKLEEKHPLMEPTSSQDEERVRDVQRACPR